MERPDRFTARIRSGRRGAGPAFAEEAVHGVAHGAQHVVGRQIAAAADGVDHRRDVQGGVQVQQVGDAAGQLLGRLTAFAQQGVTVIAQTGGRAAAIGLGADDGGQAGAQLGALGLAGPLGGGLEPWHIDHGQLDLETPGAGVLQYGHRSGLKGGAVVQAVGAGGPGGGGPRHHAGDCAIVIGKPKGREAGGAILAAQG
ncbi:MAG: hypothetical protein B7Z13_16330 [Caulobacterales bacterium 32-67-6]|nr:MAG: hypothetical protein B7Z13_16330 [Caulobacterales bacterium 32-67-6]